MRFPISVHCSVLSSLGLAPFLPCTVSAIRRVKGRKYGQFPCPFPFSARTPEFPLEVPVENYRIETKVMALFYSEDRMMVVWVILTQYQRVIDRQTDGQADLL